MGELVSLDDFSSDAPVGVLANVFTGIGSAISGSDMSVGELGSDIYASIRELSPVTKSVGELVPVSKSVGELVISGIRGYCWIL